MSNIQSTRDIGLMEVKRSDIKGLLRRQLVPEEVIAREDVVKALCKRVYEVIRECFATSASRREFFTSGHIFVTVGDRYGNSSTLGVPVAAGTIISRLHMMRHGAWEPLLKGKTAILTTHIRRQLLKSLSPVSAEALRAAIYEIKIIPDVRASSPSVYTNSGDINELTQ